MAKSGLLVVGSGPAGVAAAEAYRAVHPHDRVRILTADGDAPYARPPLSKEYLRGDTEDVELHDAQWYEDRDIELTVATTVERIAASERAMYVDGRPLSYDALVLACGASPSRPSLPGSERALLLRSLADARTLRAAATEATSAVVIGSGFIGCEAAASLAARGVTATVVAPESLPQQHRLGGPAAARLRELVEVAGVHHVGGVTVEEITDAGVRLDDGVTIDCDLVVAATGVSPRSELASKAGLRLRDGRIAVGADMATSSPAIYAAGDVAVATHAVAGRPLATEHWGDASEQGAVAGAAAAGESATWTAVPGFWTVIGEATLKYHAWGDGYDRSRLVDHGDGFTAWYQRDGAVVGVLTHDADDDYELGERLIAEGRPAPVTMD